MIVTVTNLIQSFGEMWIQRIPLALMILLRLYGRSHRRKSKNSFMPKELERRTLELETPHQVAEDFDADNKQVDMDVILTKTKEAVVVHI